MMRWKMLSLIKKQSKVIVVPYVGNVVHRAMGKVTNDLSMMFWEIQKEVLLNLLLFSIGPWRFSSSFLNLDNLLISNIKEELSFLCMFIMITWNKQLIGKSYGKQNCKSTSHGMQKERNTLACLQSDNFSLDGNLVVVAAPELKWTVCKEIECYY